MTLIEQLQWRYATKKFDTSKKVSEETIQKILEAGNLTASSLGIQPYHFILVKNEATRKELVAHSFNQKGVEEASHLLVLAVRTDVNEDYINQFISFSEQERSLPEGALQGYKEMCMMFLNMQDSPEKLYQWVSKQAYIALGTLLVACANEGVDSVPMEGFVPAKYDEVLGLKEHHLSSVLVLPIGYRAEEDGSQQYKKLRRPLSEMVIEK